MKSLIIAVFILAITSSCYTMLDCETRHFWDKYYDGAKKYNDCVSFRQRERDRWYERIFGF